jgi:hypothetical protein
MQTVEEVILYLQLELADAYEQYDEAKGKDSQLAMHHMVRAIVILDLLEAIR